ncbi:MAG: ATP-binding protein [Cyclobacteriaceae bacterium]
MVKRNTIGNFKKIVVVIAIFFCLPTTSYTQNQARADSLIQVLNQEGISPREKVILLKRISTLVSNPDVRIEYSLQLIEIAKSLNDNESIGFGLRSSGVASRKKGDLEESLEYLIESTEIFTSIGNDDELAKSYTEIGSTYTQNGDTKNSLLYKSKAIEVLRKTENNQVLAINLLNTGFSYYSVSNLDTALTYYNEAEPIFEEIGLEIGKAYTIGNRALVFWKQGDLETAKNDLFRAIEMLEPLGDQYGMADYYNQLGNIFLEQNQNREAIKYTAIGLEMAKEEDLKEQVRDASLLLSKLYKEQRDYEKSLNYQEQYIAYKDSIQDQETTQRLADLRTDFEVGQKQTEVDLLSVQKRNQQVVSVGLGAILLITGIFAFITLRNYREKNRINELLESQASLLTEQKGELERLNSTKDKFFSIISHDLRGPVNSFMGVSQLIRYFVESKDTDQLIEIADEMETSVGRLSSLLDNLLNWAMQQQGHFPNVPEKISSKELVEGVLNTFENMASGKKILLQADVEVEVELWADSNMTHTIIRNLVNNAIKFTPEEGTVTVGVKATDQFAEIAVSDTGVGIPKGKFETLFGLHAKKSTYGTTGEKGLGLGLQLVQEFLEVNQGSIAVDSEEGRGTTFTVRLPLFNQEKVIV